ncbi:hypothetical protein [Anaerostipes sp. MSJ-23]|uniref:hypothetical protein n=1 Tax=unclassified Anaerostipes TaxID=2635253 RepID=UPI001C128808|nr:hypothetical protein [Anaerostipes sp. MSJ-23]MBU5459204.1 hypothetical protein [Anaerostipes sp. MSJ-23]
MSDPGKKHQDQIAQWLKKVKFKRKIIGGVNEADVWKKIGQLDEKYQAALHDQKIYYEALLEEARKN